MIRKSQVLTDENIYRARQKNQEFLDTICESAKCERMYHLKKELGLERASTTLKTTHHCIRVKALQLRHSHHRLQLQERP